MMPTVVPTGRTMASPRRVRPLPRHPLRPNKRKRPTRRRLKKVRSLKRLERRIRAPKKKRPLLRQRPLSLKLIKMASSVTPRILKSSSSRLSMMTV